MNSVRGRQKGYSFVEVLTAFAILSFAVAALLPVFSNSLRATKTVETRTLARMQLESLISEIGVSKPLVEGEYVGAFDNGATWQIVITPQQTTQETTLFHLAVSVSPGSPNEEAALHVETLRIGPASVSEETNAP